VNPVGIRPEQIVIKGAHFVVYRKPDGSLWRYLDKYGKEWPFDIKEEPVVEDLFGETETEDLWD
jgi:hypothetical protein